jgi:hypothetical protein
VYSSSDRMRRKGRCGIRHGGCFFGEIMLSAAAAVGNAGSTIVVERQEESLDRVPAAQSLGSVSSAG